MTATHEELTLRRLLEAQQEVTMRTLKRAEDAEREIARLRNALEAAKKSIEDAQPSIKLGGYNAFSALCIIREALREAKG